MELPPKVVNHLLPTGNLKPRIVFGNYYLVWDPTSHGLNAKEIPQFKRFITQVIPYVTTVLFEAIACCERLAERTKTVRSHNFKETLSPRITVSRRFDNITYLLEMETDGRTILSRTERINTPGLAPIGPDFSVRWNLGELQFNRRAMTEK